MKFTMNNKEREMWIINDEGMYNWWKSTKLSKANFIKENKQEIDAAIKAMLDKKPQCSYYRE